jgi:hypothetical protein
MELIQVVKELRNISAKKAKELENILNAAVLLEQLLVEPEVVSRTQALKDRFKRQNTPAVEPIVKTRKVSASARRKMAAAQKRRWAKFHAVSDGAPRLVTKKKVRYISPAGKRRIAAAQRARWARFKALGQKKIA